ncbi:MAG: hypothetical protein LBF28_03230 [Rickettsiales bacterium]|jgi:hypothetical protein|nr:hypothetical protein [Rickettsiales bacterium]
MKKALSFLTIALVGASAFATQPQPSRQSMAAQFGAVPRATASKNQISAAAAAVESIPEKASIRAETPVAAVPADKRNKEKQACLNNNIGVGNTFVWASRYSNVNNYASMVEDTEDPENNVCFVRVELKSSNTKVSVSDIPAVYYEMGRVITCGSWADSKKLEGRILDAKKSARTWGTVAGVVGGAGVGVGAMELFGNKLIGGSVQGQKALSADELLRSQLTVMKEKKDPEYGRFMKELETLKQECESSEVWKDKKPDECDAINYEAFLSI